MKIWNWTRLIKYIKMISSTKIILINKTIFKTYRINWAIKLLIIVNSRFKRIIFSRKVQNQAVKQFPRSHNFIVLNFWTRLQKLWYNTQGMSNYQIKLIKISNLNKIFIISRLLKIYKAIKFQKLFQIENHWIFRKWMDQITLIIPQWKAA